MHGAARRSTVLRLKHACSAPGQQLHTVAGQPGRAACIGMHGGLGFEILYTAT
jgi:hypothetical protein